jgi:ribosome assembly protein 1
MLQRCLKDLRERFARVEIQASKPIVPFRETAVKAAGKYHTYYGRNLFKFPPDMAPTKTPNAPRGTIHGSSSLNIVRFTVRASPLPGPILGFVLANIAILKKLQNDRKAKDSQVPQNKAIVGETINDNVHGDIIRKPTVTSEQFWGALQKVCHEVGGQWEGIVERIWAFGPQGAGGCLLIDGRKSAPTSFVLYSRFDDETDT